MLELPAPVTTVRDLLRCPPQKLLELEQALPLQSPLRPVLLRAIKAQEREAFLERGQKRLAAAKIAEHRRQIGILEGDAGFCDGVLSSMG